MGPAAMTLGKGWGLSIGMLVWPGGSQCAAVSPTVRLSGSFIGHSYCIIFQVFSAKCSCENFMLHVYMTRYISRTCHRGQGVGRANGSVQAMPHLHRRWAHSSNGRDANMPSVSNSSAWDVQRCVSEVMFCTLVDRGAEIERLSALVSHRGGHDLSGCPVSAGVAGNTLLNRNARAAWIQTPTSYTL